MRAASGGSSSFLQVFAALIIIVNYCQAASLTLTWLKCNDENNAADKCVLLDFGNNITDKALLTDSVNNGIQCIWEGTLEMDGGTRIAMTSSCPFEKYDNLQVSFWMQNMASTSFFMQSIGANSYSVSECEKPFLNEEIMQVPQEALERNLKSQQRNLQDGFQLGIKAYFSDNFKQAFGTEVLSEMR